MTDVQANIGVHIDTSDSLAQIKALQRQLALFHTSISRSSSEAAIAQRGMQTNLLNSVNAIKGVTAELRTVKSTSEAFTTSLEKNKFSMREYFRYAGASTKTFGKIFKSEFDTIGRVAEARVRALQTQYIKLGRDSTGAMKAMAVMPDNLDLKNRTTQLQLAAQKQALFNQLLKQGSTNLLNFGKNTQWAGRQLMVGFTVPLMMAGGAASKVFMEMEASALKFKKVYGDLMTSPQETADALSSVQELAKGFTKYGVAASKTVALAASAAAAGFKGVDLQKQTTEATRLSVLGQIESQQALETTISLHNAFKVSSQDLAETIDFLNAVENQTVLSLDDITLAIPKAAPVVRGLGGDVKDLAFFLTAMKEGGVNASEGANALKSGLGKLIAPTKSATALLTSMGIDLNGIVKKNVGNVKATVLEFGEALNGLSDQDRQKALVKTFGIMQYARLGAMFNNVTKEGTQAARVLDLMGASVQDLANLSSKELGITADSPMVQFQKSVEDLKIAIIPIGKIFLEAVTPVLKSVAGLLEKFDGMSDGVKKVITVITIAIAGLGPVILMAFGLLANGVANIMKLFGMLRSGYLRLSGQSRVLGEQTQYLTMEQLEAAAASHSLNQAHANLTQVFTLESTAVKQLASAYQAATIAAQKFAISNPGMMAARGMPKKYADGVAMVPGSGNGDTVPAMLTPGEAVIPKKMTQKYSGLIRGMISDNIPGFAKGGVAGGHFLGMPRGFKSVTDKRNAQSLMDTISAGVSSSRFGGMVPTNFGTQISATTGHSFPVPGVGGLYQKADGTRVFVKPMMDDVAALAEQRATTIARDVHGLHSPKQDVHTMIDPTDRMGQRKLIVLVSPYDESFANPSGKFTKGEYFKQLVAANLRGDKDLQMANMSGKMLADVGTAGVFKMASGQRSFADSMPSMAEQAGINLLGTKGGAKRFFAEATMDVPRSMTAEAYHLAMMKEIDTTLPKLKKTISGFKLNDPESKVYRDMISRLEEGAKVDWRGYHSIHSSVVPTPGKPKTAAAILKKQEEDALKQRQSGHANRDPLYRYAGGVRAVPGSGDGDTVPAMLTPGEAVIPKKMASKYRGLIHGMIADNIPGFKKGTTGINTFTNAVIKIPDTQNRELSRSTGTNRAALRDSMSVSGDAIYAGVIDGILQNLGARTPEEAAQMFNERPELTKFVKSSHKGMMAGLAKGSTQILDEEFGNIAQGSLRKAAKAQSPEIQSALEAYLTDPRMISDASRGGGRSPDRLKLFKNFSGYKTRDLSRIESSLGGLNPDFKYNMAHITPATMGQSPEDIRALVAKSGHEMSNAVDESLTRVSAGVERPSRKSLEAGGQMARLQGKKDQEAYNAGRKAGGSSDAYVAGRQRKSPHALAGKDGRDDGVAYTKARNAAISQTAPTYIRNVKKASQMAMQEEISRSHDAALMINKKVDEQLNRKTTIREKVSGSRFARGLAGGKSGMLMTAGMMAGSMLPGQVGQVAGQVAQMGMMAQMMGFSLKTLPGPLKLLGVAAGVAYVGMKVMNALQERARLKIEGLGDVAVLTTEKMSVLGNIFGVTAKDFKISKTGLTAQGAGARSGIESLKANADFQKAYKNDIAAIKKASPGQAKISLQSMGIQLVGQGFAPDMVKTIVTAIQEEAGKTSLKLNFKEMDLNSGDVMARSAAITAKQFADAFKSEKGWRLAFEDAMLFPVKDFSDKAKIAMDSAAKVSAGNFQGMINQYNSGALSTKKFNSQLSRVSKSIDLIGSQKAKTAFLSSMFKNVDAEAQKATSGIKSAADMLKVFTALSIGAMSLDDKIIKVLNDPAQGAAAKSRAKNQLGKRIKETMAAIDAATKVEEKKNGNATTDTSDKFDIYKEMKKNIDGIKDQIEAYKKLRLAKIEDATATEIAGNAEMAAVIAKSGNTTEIMKQIRAYEALKKVLEKQREAGLDNGDALIANLNRKNALIQLQEKLISMKYTESIERENEALASQSYRYSIIEREIEAIEQGKILSNQRIIEENNYLMEQMSAKEDLVNEKYDLQEQTLSNILKINQDITALQQSRVSLADALSRGDISAAAQSIVELRGRNASSALGAQGDTLAAARKQELTAIGRVELEKENKKLQLEILKIEHDKILPLKQQAEAVQKLMDISQNAIADMEENTRVAIVNNNLAFLKAFGTTKTAIENTLSALDLAKTAGVNINEPTFLTNILNSALGSTSDIETAIKKVTKETTKLMTEIATMRESMGIDALAEASDSVVDLAIKAFEAKLKITQDALDALKKLYEALANKSGSATVTPPPGTQTPVVPEGPCGKDRPYYNYYTGTCVATAAEVKPATSTPSGTSPIVDNPLDDRIAKEAAARARAIAAAAEAARLDALAKQEAQNAAKVAELNRLAALGLLPKGYSPEPSRGGGGGPFAMQALAKGGLVMPKYFAAGGFARGTDTVPAMLTPGEFIMRKNAVDKFGVQNLHNINNGGSTSGTVYNYNLKVELNGTDLDVNDVASAVMGKIKQVESQRLGRR